MKLEIQKDWDNPLLSRRRVTLLVEYDGATPSRAVIRKEVAKKVGAEESLITIRHVYSRFGRQKAKVVAHVYTYAEVLKKLEDEYVQKRHGAGAEAKSTEGAQKQEA